jgi:membrane protease YdiL (CAAX protease family)
VSTQTTTFGRIFGPGDGRDRIAVPFWDGVLSIVGVAVVLVVSALVAAVVFTIGVVSMTGNKPSLNPGHPLLSSTLIGSYIGAGVFAWWRLRAMGRLPFARLRSGDLRTILIGVAVIVLVWIATAFQLAAMHQSKHVQAGFEHFTVIGKLPNVTGISVALTLLSMVVFAPFTEELLFRGLLFGTLAPRVGTFAGALISAILFGAAHGDPLLIAGLAALGFVNAIAYAATGNLWVPIAIHAINNAISSAFLVAASLQGLH